MRAGWARRNSQVGTIAGGALGVALLLYAMRRTPVASSPEVADTESGS